MTTEIQIFCEQSGLKPLSRPIFTVRIQVWVLIAQLGGFMVNHKVVI